MGLVAIASPSGTYHRQLERGQGCVGVYYLPLHALLLEMLAVAFSEVVHAAGVVLAAIERKREAADLEAHLDHIRSDHCPRLLAPRRHSPTSRGLQLARFSVGDRCCGMDGVHSPQQPLHLLVEHAV